MENPIYISLSRMIALRHQMDVVANNVANASSTGFKQQRVVFTEFLDKPAMGERLSLVQDRAVARDMRPGAMLPTSNPLDVAISGKGYFVVDTVNGPHYTRSGHFQLDAKGQITDNNGLPVLDANNRPITLPRGATEVRITSDGSVMTNINPTQAVGKLAVVSFPKEQLMSDVGGGLYLTDQKSEPLPKETKVTQGMLEQSNVQPIVEMTSMINVLRQYQGMQKIVDGEHDRQKQMIQKLGRTS